MSLISRAIGGVGVLVFSVMAGLPRSHAAGYYVDYAAGSDVAHGTSVGAPWKHCPGDAAATGKAAAARLAAGDTVYFKGGVAYVLTSTKSYSVYGLPGIKVNRSGTASQPITYDGNSAGTWGDGKAIITDNHGSGHLAFFLHYGVSNLAFNGLEFARIGGAAPLPPDTGSPVPARYGAGIYAEVGFVGVWIGNCYFHELGYWQNQKPVGNSSLGGHGIRAAGATGKQAVETAGLTITNCELTRIRQPIQINCFKSCVDIDIVDCFIHDYTEWCMDLAYQTGSYMDNLSIHGCRFQDWDKWYSKQYWAGYGDAPHQNGIYFRANVAWLVMGTNVNFYNNTFKSTGDWSGGTSALYMEGPLGANVYNNVFDNVHPANAALVLQEYLGSTNFYANILNNTFYVTSAAIYFTHDDCDQDVNRIYVTNNIFVNPIRNVGYQFLLSFNSRSQGSFLTNVVPSIKMDHNSYLIFNNNLPLKLVGINQPGYNWVTMDTLHRYGWDLHGLTNAPGFVDAANGNYRLKPTSRQIGAGANLSDLKLPGLNLDKDGHPRPITGRWSMGAYEGAEANP